MFLDNRLDPYADQMIEHHRAAVATKIEGVEDVQDVAAIKAKLDIVMYAVSSQHALTYEGEEARRRHTQSVVRLRQAVVH
ncbi:MAG TPA: hypothetical protein VGF12_25390 [Roseateles sp.]|uniref:hypothetical protein n=1 Tax=Roseateles sp. TaxID=1971397 RepID=UPI002ED8C99D